MLCPCMLPSRTVVLWRKAPAETQSFYTSEMICMALLLWLPRARGSYSFDTVRLKVAQYEYLSPSLSS